MQSTARIKTHKRLKPATIIVTGFLALIFLGGTLLLFPFARESGTFAAGGEILDSYFTAVSASCVTGLVVADTATAWSIAGQVIILIMIQIGGLGFMAVSVIVSILVRRKISPMERMVIAQSINLSSASGIVKLIKRVLIGTFGIEFIGALILFLRFKPIFGTGKAIYYGIFHAVSAFCNAGFDVFGGYSGEFSSIYAFRGDFIVLSVLSSLIIVGGIGFIIWDDMIDYIKRRNPLSAYTKFVLIISGGLIVTGTLLILISEYSNPATIGDMNFFGKLLNSYFHSVSCRTAGFDAISCAGLTDIGKVVSIALMFIGGASGSTAGGIKVSTAGLLIYTIYCVLKGKTVIVIFKREVSNVNVMRAMSICAVGLALIVSFGFIIQLITPSAEIIDVAMETVSAFGTVGLSSVGTFTLGALSKFLLMVLMFFGRVGILTVSYALLEKLKHEERVIKYPEANMLIG